MTKIWLAFFCGLCVPLALITSLMVFDWHRTIHIKSALFDFFSTSHLSPPKVELGSNSFIFEPLANVSLQNGIREKKQFGLVELNTIQTLTPSSVKTVCFYTMRELHPKFNMVVFNFTLYPEAKEAFWSTLKEKAGKMVSLFDGMHFLGAASLSKHQLVNGKSIVENRDASSFDFALNFIEPYAQYGFNLTQKLAPHIDLKKCEGH